MDKVSVIIPTYNRQNTLLRAVNSALQQTYPVHEILICDDGSSDNSKKIIAELNNSKIKWIDCGRNNMPSVPRNIGIKASAGEWVSFLDSDDEWLPAKTEIQLSHLKKSNTVAASCNAYRIVNNKNEGLYLSCDKKYISFSDLLAVNNNICSSVIIRKKILEQISLFPEEKKYKAIEDYALWLRISARINFSYIAQPLLNYYDNPELSLRTNYTDVRELRRIIFSGLIDWLKHNKSELSTKDKKKLTMAYTEVLNNGKVSIWQKVKQKIKYHN